MHTASVLPCSHCNFISADICVHGKPCGTQLTQEHIAVFINEGFTIPADDAVVLYSKVHFRSTGRIAKSKRTFRTGLRNNSGIVFCDQAGRICYGELLLVVLFTCVNHAYAIVLPYIPTGEMLSNDRITDCIIDQHIMKLHLP